MRAGQVELRLARPRLICSAAAGTLRTGLTRVHDRLSRGPQPVVSKLRRLHLDEVVVQPACLVDAPQRMRGDVELQLRVERFAVQALAL